MNWSQRVGVWLAFLPALVVAFTSFESVVPTSPTQHTISTTHNMASSQDTTTASTPHPFCELPGDPSLILTTNVDLGAKKLDVMKGISKAIAKHTGKPESYVAVSVTDNAAVIFGGSDAPCALGIMGSIGAIAKESNGAITSDVTDLLEEFGVTESRIYINFFDMPRSNVGWSRRTFAG